MAHARKRPFVWWCLPLLLCLAGCDARPECDSSETRLAVPQTVSSDHANALADFAAKNATPPKATDASPAAEQTIQKPTYLLGDKIVTTSTSADKRTLQCSSSLSATVGDTKASKEIDFSVQQAPGGKINVTVAPFRF